MPRSISVNCHFDMAFLALLNIKLKSVEYQQADPSLPLQSRRTNVHTKARSRNRYNCKTQQRAVLGIMEYSPDDRDDKSFRSRLTSQSISLSWP